MPDFPKSAEKLKSLFSKDMRLKLIVVLGLLGMALILISQLTDSGGAARRNSHEPTDTTTAQFTVEGYAEQLETKLLGLITNIDGVGEAQVMVTLEQGVEYVYAQEEKSSVDKTGSDDGKSTFRQDSQYSYVLVDTEYGKKQALVKTEVQPKVQGVIIVCEGADDVRVQQKLINVVTTALNIPSTRVCVVKINL